MGRGGTKFESEAIGVRAGRKKFGVSTKEMKKEMEVFQKTGRHPGLNPGSNHVLPSLPVRDPNRPHVFLNFVSGKNQIGKILVEVFEPELPVTCRNFMNRCNPGAANSFKGTKVHSLVENYALHGGLSKGHQSTQQRRSTYLRHVQSGLVSLSTSGDAFALTFERALTLDDTHQVVGRLHGEASMETLQRLNALPVGQSDEPVHALRISDCGQTDSQGNYDPLVGEKRKEKPEETSARIAEEEADARDALGAALEQGLMRDKPGSNKGAQHKKRRQLSSSESDSESGGSSRQSGEKS